MCYYHMEEMRLKKPGDHYSWFSLCKVAFDIVGFENNFVSRIYMLNVRLDFCG